jgi:hypothetical protein
MANRNSTFLLKRSNIIDKVPNLTGLTIGELALNTADSKLYTIFTSGTTGATEVRQIGWDRVSRTGDTITGDLYVTGKTITNQLQVTGGTLTSGYVLTSDGVGNATWVSPTIVSGYYLPLSGGTVTGGTSFNSGLTANTIYTDYIDFNTNPTVPSPTGGTLYFDSNENALSYKPLTNQNDVTVNLGQESLIKIYNNLGYQINNGQVLHITGATGGVPTVALANASKLGTTFTESIAQTSGVATHDIPTGEFGFMTNFGIVRDLNTTAFTVGQEVFLSDTIDGALTNDPNNIAFTSRISTVGYCIESDPTNGKILVVITNENALQSLTQQEINVLLGNTISTGAYFYTGATTASTTTINVSPVRGWIVYNTGSQYATNPLVLNVYYSGGTNLPVTGLTSSSDTYLLVNSGGTLYQTNTFPSPEERRYNIFLGRVVHPNKTTILNVEQSVDYDVSPLSSLRDLWVPIKIINEGVVPSPNGATLTFKTSSGTFWGNGIGFPTNELNPNSITVPAYIPASFYYTTQTGGTFTATTTTVDSENYDVGGVITNIPGAGNYSTQRIYMSQSGVIRLQYGQNYYSTLAKAIAAIPSETFIVNPDNSLDCTLIGLLTVKDGTSDLSNADDAIFTFVSKFGEILGGTGGISTTTLQQAYDNSINPEIVTNTTLGGVQFKGGTGNNTDKNIIIENNSSVETGYWNADGSLFASTITGGTTTINGNLTVTGNTSLQSLTAGTSTINGNLTVTGNTSLQSLTAGTSTINGNLTVTGNTSLQGLTATTISATTYQNLPTDIRVTGASYSNNTFTYTNNTGGTFSVLFNTLTGLTVNGNLTVTGNTSLQSLTAGTSTINGNLSVTGNTSMTGTLSVTGNTNIRSFTGTSGYISGSGQNILTVIGSGNSTTSPLFTVQGSSGELFSVTDSLTGSLFSVNDISGLPILEVFSDNRILQGSYLAPSLNTTVRTSLTAGTNSVYSIPTSAYTGAFFDYTLISTGSTGARAGTIMSIWSGSTTQYTDVSTNDIGTTTGVTFSVAVSGSNAVLSSSATTTGWTLKTIVRSI